MLPPTPARPPRGHSHEPSRDPCTPVSLLPGRASALSPLNAPPQPLEAHPSAQLSTHLFWACLDPPQLPRSLHSHPLFTSITAASPNCTGAPQGPPVHQRPPPLLQKLLSTRASAELLARAPRGSALLTRQRGVLLSLPRVWTSLKGPNSGPSYTRGILMISAVVPSLCNHDGSGKVQEARVVR